MTNASSSGRGFDYWLTIFANLAVVGGIIFLGIEVRQNTQMMRAQTRNEISQSIIGFLDLEREARHEGGTSEAVAGRRGGRPALSSQLREYHAAPLGERLLSVPEWPV